MYTVKQLSDLAGVSARTLHYYDQIGLLKPASHGENGYRYYSEEALLRLQQILFYKELDLPLEKIREILNSPDFDLLQALESHKDSLKKRAERFGRLIHTVDQTILYLKGDADMTKKQLFEEFSEEKQKKYEEEIRQRYGEKAFEGVTDWNSYTPAKKEQIKAEGEAIYQDVIRSIRQGKDPASSEVQQMVARWHQHLRYFYEPSVERLRGLAQMYNEHPDFIATFTRMHPDLPVYWKQAIDYYCNQL